MDKGGEIGYNLCIMAPYDHKKIEAKCQKRWEKQGTWKVDFAKSKKA